MSLDIQRQVTFAIASHAVPEGTLNATWELESSLPLHANGTKHAALDRHFTYYDDHVPRYTSPASGEIVEFPPRFDGRWVLVSVLLETAPAEYTTLCKLHRVVGETRPDLSGVGPMRRSDRKLGWERYGLEGGKKVEGCEIGAPGSRFARLTVANGTKYVLEMQWGRGMSLVDVVDGLVDDGGEEEEEEMESE